LATGRFGGFLNKQLMTHILRALTASLTSSPSDFLEQRHFHHFKPVVTTYKICPLPQEMRRYEHRQISETEMSNPHVTKNGNSHKGGSSSHANSDDEFTGFFDIRHENFFGLAKRNKISEAAMSNSYIIEHGNSYEGGSLSHADSDDELLNFFDPRHEKFLSLNDNEFFAIYALHGSQDPLSNNVEEIRVIAAARPDKNATPETTTAAQEVWRVTTMLQLGSTFEVAEAGTPEEAMTYFVSSLIGAIEDEPVDDIEAPLTYQGIIDARPFISVSLMDGDKPQNTIPAMDARFDVNFDIEIPDYKMR
jgi:hypothetical protein